jgi:hypothetical protein
MTVTKTHHYAVGEADLDELLARRAALITAVRAELRPPEWCADRP